MDFLLRRFKNLKDFGAAFGLAGLGCIALSNYTGYRWLLHLGIALLGAAAIAWGANNLAGNDTGIFQRGIPAGARIGEGLTRLWGIVIVGGGLLVLGYGVLALLNPRTPIPPGIQQFFSTPQGTGILLLVGSSVGILFALSTIAQPDVRGRDAFTRFFGNLMQRLVGIMLLALCGALFALGLYQILHPTPWDEILRGLWSYLSM